MQLFNGDCLEIMQTLSQGSVDMVFADLPYGTTANKWDSIIPLDKLWLQFLRIGKNTTPYVFTANSGFQHVVYNSKPDLYKYDWVWDKIIPGGMSYARFQPMRQHEYVLVFYDQTAVYNPQMIKRDKPIKSGGQKNLNTGSTTLDNYKVEGFTREYAEKNPISILPFMKIRQHSLHPTQKPVELLEYLIKTYTNENDVVLDPTMGSGTTAIACLNLNRNFIGIEKDTQYFKLASERIHDHAATLLTSLSQELGLYDN